MECAVFQISASQGIGLGISVHYVVLFLLSNSQNWKVSILTNPVVVPAAPEPAGEEERAEV